MSSQSGSEHNHRQARKSTKKTKVEAAPEKKSRRNNRKNNQMSENQNGLPQNIPLTQSNQIIIFRSFELEVYKQIVQIPISLFKSGTMNQQAEATVGDSTVTLKYSNTQSEQMIVEAKLKDDEDNSEKNSSSKKDGEKNHNSNQQDDQNDILEGEQITFLVWGKICWVGTNEVNSKTIKQAFKGINTLQQTELLKIKVKDICSDIFIVLSLKKKIQCVTDFNGLINQGNTCYMNSYLQMLNHIAQFKNLVFEAGLVQENKFPATLQTLFHKLDNDQKPVSAEQLVKSFGWSKKQANIQQDAQEFSCLFYDVLERKLQEACPDPRHMSMSELFEGNSSNEEPFFNIPLSLSGTLEKSLDDYVADQILSQDNLYQTEEYGPQVAKKSVKFLLLPPVLMIQLKRFEFNYYTNKNQKILHRFQYPETVDFSKWQISSTGPCQYQLYAVLVHEGLKSESGHYVAYIQVDDDWYRFNDQQVSRASVHQVYEYNFGGDIDTLQFDSREFKVNNRKTIASSTAYMLVYVKKDLKEKILNSEPIYPSWLKQHQIIKQEQREENRNRKNFFHDVPALDWCSDLKDGESDYVGLFPKNFELIEAQIIKKVPKNQKIEEWIKPYNQKGVGVYLYLTCFQKTEYETLINLQHRKSTFSDLIRDTGSSITMIYFPIQINFDNYLYIIKLLTVKPSMQQQKESQPQIAIHFHEYLEISRNSKNSELINKLKQMYCQQGFQLKFYYEEKKELIQIKQQNTLVKGPPSVRNILGLIIVEKLPSSQASEQQSLAVKWYNDQKNIIEITVKSQDGKYSFSTEIDQSKSVQSFRQYIFENKVNKDEDYFSPENIVLKTKPKKTAKNFVEVSGAKTIKDLIKNCDKENIVVFSYSNLKADERVNQVEVKFCYRFQDFSFSDFFHIILDRKCTNQSESMYLKISNHEEIKKMTQKQNLSSIRILLFSKEKSVINDIVSENGHVHGKGEIAQVLQKQKGIQLVVIGFNQEIIEENFCPVLLQHRSQNNEKIGTPRYLQFPRSTLLTSLYNQILDLIKDESYQWEEKKIKCCPIKICLFAYSKDISKGIYIYDEATMKQHALNEERQLQKDAKKLLKKEKELQNSNKKQDQSVNKQESQKPQQIIVIDDQKFSPILEEPKNQTNFLLPPKSTRINQSDENEEENSNDGASSQPQSKRKNSKIEKLKDWEKTINSAFSKARVIRILVQHPYICKAQTAMRLNVL